ncbi:MAG: LacI family transcriptional regulator [Chloroflexi bacterium]|nr:LacI family transcriptional regulator [Chloroflexota bacterium]
MREIAHEVGVSTATVSRALNSPERVRPAVRERVAAAALRLGYRPNRVARSLRTQRTYTLGVVVPTITNPYFADAVRAMQDVASECGYTLLVANSDHQPAKEEAALATFGDHRVDGLILVSTSREAAPSAVLNGLLQNRTPIVVVDRALPYLDVSRVLVDTRGGARGAIQHLVDRGRRRIAFIAGPAGVWTAEEKLMGYYEGLLAANIPADPELLLPGDYTVESGESRAVDLIAMRSRPNAVLIANNLMTLGALRVLLQAGVAIPRDLAIVGFDDVAWTDVVRPTLTVVAQPTQELGRQAIDVLLARIAHPELPPKQPVHLLPTKLIVRQSS